MDKVIRDIAVLAAFCFLLGIVVGTMVGELI
jgi:hypothetical protein